MPRMLFRSLGDMLLAEMLAADKIFNKKVCLAQFVLFNRKLRLLEYCYLLLFFKQC